MAAGAPQAMQLSKRRRAPTIDVLFLIIRNSTFPYRVQGPDRRSRGLFLRWFETIPYSTHGLDLPGMAGDLFDLLSPVKSYRLHFNISLEKSYRPC